MIKIFKDQEIGGLTTEFHNLIKEHKLYKKYTFEMVKNDPYYKYTIIRQTNSYKRRINVIEEYKHLIRNKFDINEQELRYEIYAEDTMIRIFNILQIYEYLKRFFITYLDLEKLNQITDSKIKEDSTYGQIISAFEKLDGYNKETTKLFDNPSRNLFAHFDWFMFKEDGVTTSKGLINFDDLYDKMVNMNKLYQCITTNHIKDIDGILTPHESKFMINLWEDIPEQL